MQSDFLSLLIFMMTILCFPAFYFIVRIPWTKSKKVLTKKTVFSLLYLLLVYKSIGLYQDTIEEEDKRLISSIALDSKIFVNKHEFLNTKLIDDLQKYSISMGGLSGSHPSGSHPLLSESYEVIFIASNNKELNLVFQRDSSDPLEYWVQWNNDRIFKRYFGHVITSTLSDIEAVKK